jgi:aryl-alcohol dehydrogenase-like predicted oxidoreductase
VELRRLGGSDLEVSRVGLGCNNFGGRLDRDGTRAVIDAALDAGVTFLDTADIYGGGDSERFIGHALAGRRDSVVLATKFGQDTGISGPGGAPEHVHRAIDASLERLGTASVDLYYYHRPDGVTPIADTLGAMQELVDAGKVRWLGLSNVDAGLLREAVATGIPIVAVQNYYSLLHRDDDDGVLPLCRELGIGYVPYFPLESGLLTGKYRRGEPHPEGARLSGRDDRLTDERLQQVEALEALAEARGVTLLEVVLGGLASIPGIASVISGATRPEQVRANTAAGGWRASADDLEQIASALARRDAG